MRWVSIRGADYKVFWTYTHTCDWLGFPRRTLSSLVVTGANSKLWTLNWPCYLFNPSRRRCSTSLQTTKSLTHLGTLCLVLVETSKFNQIDSLQREGKSNLHDFKRPHVYGRRSLKYKSNWMTMPCRALAKRSIFQRWIGSGRLTTFAAWTMGEMPVLVEPCVAYARS